MLSFVVPGQPQGKGRSRIGRVGNHARMFTPAKTVAYEGLIAHAAAQAMDGAALMDGAVMVSLFMHCQIPASWSTKKRSAALSGSIFPTTKPDADNCAKAAFDGMNGVVFRDDVQVVECHIRKRYSDTPRLVIGVEAIQARHESIST